MPVATLDERERLGMAEAAATLGITAISFWWLHWRRVMCPASGRANGSPYWHRDDLYRWAARSDVRRFVRRTPLRYWPDATKPATYLGSTVTADYVAQEWDAAVGTLVVLWPLPDRWPSPNAARAAARFPSADSLVRVGPDFGLDGPTLGPAQPGDPDPEWQDFAARWNDLARILGQPAPYWPFQLRIPHLIDEWRPGSPTVTYPARPDLDIVPLLRLMLALPPDGLAHKAVRGLAALAQHRATLSANANWESVRQLQRNRGSKISETTALAVFPSPYPEPDELDKQQESDGWHEILDRTDRLAADCVRLAAAWDGGKHFRYASIERVNPATRYGAEWLPGSLNRRNAPPSTSFSSAKAARSSSIR
jgi:hypothetical protein